ncbi:MAG: hypothetical protein LBV28_05710 [Puniceicoccales bacterium]|jgi:hypothetical protein|nr:hypothetical protein [Puniceicoccales bacterium]
MNSIIVNPHLCVPALRWREQSLYLWSAAFVAGNLVLPQLCHLAPMGGKMLLPIYFFTLIGAAAFGWRVGVITALASPLLNSLLFSMPTAEMLPVIVTKSLLIAAIAPVVLHRVKTLPLALLLVVLGYQTAGGFFEWAWTGTYQAALHDLTNGWLGMVAQVLLGWTVLAALPVKGRGGDAADAHGHENL